MAIPPRLAAIVRAHAPRRIEGDELEQLRVNAAYRESAGNVTRRVELEARIWEESAPAMDAGTRLRAVCDAFGIAVPDGLTEAQALKALGRLSRKSQAVQSARAGYTGGGAGTMRTVKASQVKRRDRRARMRAMGQ